MATKVCELYIVGEPRSWAETGLAERSRTDSARHRNPISTPATSFQY